MRNKNVIKPIDLFLKLKKVFSGIMKQAAGNKLSPVHSYALCLAEGQVETKKGVHTTASEKRVLNSLFELPVQS